MSEYIRKVNPSLTVFKASDTLDSDFQKSREIASGEIAPLENLFDLLLLKLKLDHPKEAYALKKIICDNSSYSLVAKRLQVSKQRISQLVKQAFNHLSLLAQEYNKLRS